MAADELDTIWFNDLPNRLRFNYNINRPRRLPHNIPTLFSNGVYHLHKDQNAIVVETYCRYYHIHHYNRHSVANDVRDIILCFTYCDF